MQDFDLNKPPNKNESGVLALLWRKILKENNFMPALGMLVNRYMREQDQAALKQPTLKKKNRATLITNITAPEMTIKTFFDLVFRFIKAKKITITVKVTYNNDDTSVHSISVDGSNFQHEHEENENVDEGVKDVKSRDSKKHI